MREKHAIRRPDWCTGQWICSPQITRSRTSGRSPSDDQKQHEQSATTRPRKSQAGSSHGSLPPDNGHIFLVNPEDVRVLVIRRVDDLQVRVARCSFNRGIASCNKAQHADTSRLALAQVRLRLVEVVIQRGLDVRIHRPCRRHHRCPQATRRDRGNAGNDRNNRKSSNTMHGSNSTSEVSRIQHVDQGSIRTSEGQPQKAQTSDPT